MNRGFSLIILLLVVACGAPRAPSAPASSPPGHPRVAASLVARGRVFARLGDHTRATQYFDAALLEGARPALVLPLLMDAYVRSRRYHMAIERGERYLTEHPHDGRMRFLVATLHAAVGSAGRASDHLLCLLEREPDHASAHYALAVILRDGQADPSGAAQHFRRYLELAPRGAHAEEARAATEDAPP